MDLVLFLIASMMIIYFIYLFCLLFRVNDDKNMCVYDNCSRYKIEECVEHEFEGNK
jgi:hypothetical protein